ncbi:DUF2520 domain-containing protein [Pedobacter sp. KR3-3]|uniref:DUF2520 domain-containing protein n=1 Tax=Pedobacter albus TaxID=3113905 RepID=A0ABU7I660_9SPHI|nr:DUF2520 domain-containing protein [Pedobacter sp. KR3-3]MEE1944958.1 DUF2520 domain-containing protein [Pedobacter sp. KR3-3]
MKIVIIGSGNVATHLAIALKKAGLPVAQVWSYHYVNAVQLANQVGAQAIAKLDEVDHQAALCLIAVKDDAVAGIAEQLAGFKGLVAHTCGAVPMSVFAGKFANYGVFYPLQTFSKSKALNFDDIPLCLEANSEASMQLLKQVAIKLSNRVLEVDSDKRKILHLAAVFACNFTNHLYALGEQLLEANGLEFDILRPLINETASKVQHALPLAVQTGPAIRSDEQTLKAHQELLLQHPHLLEIYRTLSESIKKTKS